MTPNGNTNTYFQWNRQVHNLAIRGVLHPAVPRWSPHLTTAPGAARRRTAPSAATLGRSVTGGTRPAKVSGIRYVLHPFAAKYSHWMWH
jgi:hypothetical protein